MSRTRLRRWRRTNGVSNVRQRQSSMLFCARSKHIDNIRFPARIEWQDAALLCTTNMIELSGGVFKKLKENDNMCTFSAKVFLFCLFVCRVFVLKGCWRKTNRNTNKRKFYHGNHFFFNSRHLSINLVVLWKSISSFPFPWSFASFVLIKTAKNIVCQ